MAEPSRKKGKGHSKAKDDVATISDKRFANIQSDPRYRLPSKRHTHVKLDKRFAHMLRDKDFSRNAAVDRYGRKLARDDTKKQLERFYRLEDEEQDEGEDDNDADAASAVGSVDDDDVVLKELQRVEKKKKDYDPARDGGFSESSSSEESSSDEDDDEADVEEDGDDIEFPDKKQSDVPLGEVTNRIAVVNLDWDNIRAEDLMAVFSSFAAGGRISQVSIYPSEFGKERMEREEMEGPPREIFASTHDDDDDESEEEDRDPEDSENEEENIKKSILKEDEGNEFNTTQLRQYQLERLRYFYAIIEFASKETAKQVYDAIDGTEYLSSANFFDLRFVPDDTDFSDDKPREQCRRIPDGYRPTDFVTDALQHSKVKLTWDADDKARKEAQAKAFRGGRKDIEENDLKAYLASDSSDDDDDDEEGGVEIVDTTTDTASKPSKKETERQRMRALLGLKDEPVTSSKEKGPVGDMEITFTSGLAGEPARDSVFENEPVSEETTVEKYIRKQRERRKQRKEKLKASKQDGATTTDGVHGEETQQNVIAEEEDLGFDDPFFNEPEGKPKTSQRKEERRKKREERAAEEAAAAAKRAELELLMVDDQSAGMKHFDMNEIEKAEKRARKKGKKGKGKHRDDEATVSDNFEMNVKDPRFANMYDSHEFAIDPTNPKFKATSGMKAVLEESRKRRRVRDEGNDDEPVEETKKQRKGSSKRSDAGDDVDLKKLLARVKSKTKSV
ncbi:Pre-rRNA-processing protein esf1 [Talaromyces islandicus]|uniref:Pre-rRNA-processing protein esf1 n=1 Tax=Talaromyces islandicus TaxID=28573 RepID=A0A0U1M5E0_TALIS|nr:Pre-rRNA-processing protein esf1 [Talaromyces islandicus]